MIKIFLVEDEVFALQALERKIQDLNGPYQVVGSAFNGMEALSQIPLSAPDIVMTDIRMPDMDGITLIEKLQEQKLKVLPVIISGYQEFEYAQRAVRLDVKDYLVKPVNLIELKKCLEHCALQIKQRMQKENAVSFMIGEDSFSMNVFSETHSFLVIYLIVANALIHVDNIIHPNVPYLPSVEIESVLTRHLSDKATVNCFDGFFSNEKVLILSGMEEPEHRLIKALTETAKELERQTGNYISIYYEFAENSQVLSSTIRACRKKLAASMRLGCTHVYRSPTPNSISDPELKKNAELFSMLLRHRQLSLLRSNILRMFQQWQEQQQTALAIQNNLVLLLDTIRQELSHRAAFNSAFFIENIICFSRNETDLAENFYQLLVELLSENSQNERTISGKQFVEQIDTFFQEHLDQSLSLQELSEQMNVSKVYLCKVFKKHKNVTPMDYFNHLKLERAKELLIQFPNMPLREITEKIGFSNLYYFSKVFKRVVGLTPTEYRTQKQSGDN